MTGPTNAGWYKDPFGRHERRYHTGTGWTEHVKDRGTLGIDPPHAQLTQVPAPRVSPAPAPRREPAPKRTPVPAKAAVKAAASQRAPMPKRTPASVRASKPSPGGAPVRAAVPAASRAAVAIALPPVNKRAASSYLKPAPRMTPAPVPTHRVRWPWVVVIIVVLVAFTIASGIGFIKGTATEPTVAPPPPQRAPHTIRDVQYDFVTVGVTRARVIAGLGKRPADRSEYRRVFRSATTDPACAYYYGRAARRSYTFCFNDDDLLTSKTIRSLPATVPAPKGQAQPEQ